jgi:hypothetical protein
VSVYPQKKIATLKWIILNTNTLRKKIHFEIELKPTAYKKPKKF